MSKIFKQEDSEIQTSIGETFSVELESNPGTGYQWQPIVDESKVRLVEQKFQAPQGAIGASGKAIFTFQPIEGGDTTLRFAYKRAWEKSAIEQKDFHVAIEK